MLLRWFRETYTYLNDSIWWYFSREAACYRAHWHDSERDYLWPLYKKIARTSWHFKDTTVDEISKPGISVITLKTPVVIKADFIPYLLESGLGVEVGDKSEMMADIREMDYINYGIDEDGMLEHIDSVTII